ncbi:MULTISPECIES: EF-P beta-lysylation protein EpmB [unclassified Motilimonas]|uniref:EF-P beta-lysylation protein EpmB n=1 Tax=unclassified Motilimonas TaxID=2643697 RepID=UPI001E596F40|nr:MULTISPECIES: EF-P beta-lysylation protein EpmB [unclassified Motilimonas]MCE0557060.1 EF-P beta-lysylation protein EpmB [Motilimonas sp. E26]MDO6524293.1 EF-P beta-lysylation protein EpmB [Motilimonas sp. 1_MG-2023]
MPQIITRNDLPVQGHWQKELANAIKTPSELIKILNLNEKDFIEGFIARQSFPMLVPMPFVKKMQVGDKQDPLLRQVLPLKEELLEVEGFGPDPLEEHNTAVPGLLHKYKSRVLFIVKGGCAVNCRYCFRRHFPYQDNSPNKTEWHTAIDYIRQHTEINEVILSGGDPLMAKDEHIDWLLTQLEQIPHLTRVRLHTRLPVVIPSRLTDALLSRLQQSPLKAVMVLHINHANELDQELTRMLQRTRRYGITLLNQSVLLKGINDTSADLINLSEALFTADVLPYYLHQLDKVAGAAHFEVHEDKAKQLVKMMLNELPGFLVPKLVREVAGEKSKTPLDLFHP